MVHHIRRSGACQPSLSITRWPPYTSNRPSTRRISRRQNGNFICRALRTLDQERVPGQARSSRRAPPSPRNLGVRRALPSRAQLLAETTRAPKAWCRLARLARYCRSQEPSDRGATDSDSNPARPRSVQAPAVSGSSAFPLRSRVAQDGRVAATWQRALGVWKNSCEFSWLSRARRGLDPPRCYPLAPHLTPTQQSQLCTHQFRFPGSDFPRVYKRLWHFPDCSVMSSGLCKVLFAKCTRARE
jgi:hypothetical protein